MKAIAALIVLAAVAVCTWLVADGDRARMQAWGERFAAGAIEHVNDLLRHGAELRMAVERKDAEIARLRDDLEQLDAERHETIHRLVEDADDLRHQLADMATERDAAEHRQPGVVVVHIPVTRYVTRNRRHRHDCLDHIANELNAVEARR